VRLIERLREVERRKEGDESCRLKTNFSPSIRGEEDDNTRLHSERRRGGLRVHDGRDVDFGGGDVGEAAGDDMMGWMRDEE
jgi:hypothetical protein